MLELVASVLACSVAVAATPPVVAVFAVQDTRPADVRLPISAIDGVTKYLSSKLAESGAFRTVPDAQLRAALQMTKRESYEACYEESCQIEVGKEVAAGKSLSTAISQVGTECIVTSTLYDLRISAAEKSASYRGACSQADLLTAVEIIAGRLAGQAEAGAVSTAPPPAAVPSVPSVPPVPPVPGTPAGGKAEEPTIVGQWWFWALAIGALAIAGTAVAIAATSGADDPGTVSTAGGGSSSGSSSGGGV